jgi:hypothetical protein
LHARQIINEHERKEAAGRTGPLLRRSWPVQEEITMRQAESQQAVKPGASCSRAAPPLRPSARAALSFPAIGQQTKIRYTLSWLPTGQYAFVYMARQLGFWKNGASTWKSAAASIDGRSTAWWATSSRWAVPPREPSC